MNILRDVAKALVHIHDNGGIHRDIKPGISISFLRFLLPPSFSLILLPPFPLPFPSLSDFALLLRNTSFSLGNVLVSEGPVCKVSDMGFAAQVGSLSYLKEEVGTHLYVAPEIILHEPYRKPVDVFSFGTPLRIFILIAHLTFGRRGRRPRAFCSSSVSSSWTSFSFHRCLNFRGFDRSSGASDGFSAPGLPA